MLPREAADLFHLLRVDGNRAVHADTGTHSKALSALKTARLLGIWFHRTFAAARFVPGPFIRPPDPAAATTQLQQELDRLRRALDETRSAAERARSAPARSARSARSTSGVHNVNSAELGALNIPKPTLAEQAEIICRIESAFARIERTADEAERAAALLDRLDQATLARAFRGEL